MVNEARAHFLPSHVRLQGFLQGPDWNGTFGVTGLSDLLPDLDRVFPDYAWSGYGSLQGSGFDQRPKSQDRKAFEGTDNFTILKGKQAIKFGVLFRYYQWLGYDSQSYAGSFTFNGNATGNNTASGDAYADFLLGYPSAYETSTNNFGGQGLYKQFFLQDLRVNDRLTVNLGLRYEYSPWLDGYKGQIGTFDPSQSKPIIVSGTGTVPDLTAQYAAPAAYQFFGQYIQTSSQAGLPLNITYTNKTQFAPRLGVSVSANRKTVVRAGLACFDLGIAVCQSQHCLSPFRDHQSDPKRHANTKPRQLLPRFRSWFRHGQPIAWPIAHPSQYGNQYPLQHERPASVLRSRRVGSWLCRQSRRTPQLCQRRQRSAHSRSRRHPARRPYPVGRHLIRPGPVQSLRFRCRPSSNIASAQLRPLVAYTFSRRCSTARPPRSGEIRRMSTH
jgi:hypothetical protein